MPLAAHLMAAARLTSLFAAARRALHSSGSPAKFVNSLLSGQGAGTQQVEAGRPGHSPLDRLQPVHVPYDRAVTPRQIGAGAQRGVASSHPRERLPPYQTPGSEDRDANGSRQIERRTSV